MRCLFFIFMFFDFFNVIAMDPRRLKGSSSLFVERDFCCAPVFGLPFSSAEGGRPVFDLSSRQRRIGMKEMARELPLDEEILKDEDGQIDLFFDRRKDSQIALLANQIYNSVNGSFKLTTVSRNVVSEINTEDIGVLLRMVQEGDCKAINEDGTYPLGTAMSVFLRSKYPALGKKANKFCNRIVTALAESDDRLDYPINIVRGLLLGVMLEKSTNHLDLKSYLRGFFGRDIEFEEQSSFDVGLNSIDRHYSIDRDSFEKILIAAAWMKRYRQLPRIVDNTTLEREGLKYPDCSETAARMLVNIATYMNGKVGYSLPALRFSSGLTDYFRLDKNCSVEDVHDLCVHRNWASLTENIYGVEYKSVDSNGVEYQVMPSLSNLTILLNHLFDLKMFKQSDIPAIACRQDRVIFSKKYFPQICREIGIKLETTDKLLDKNELIDNRIVLKLSKNGQPFNLNIYPDHLYVSLCDDGEGLSSSTFQLPDDPLLRPAFIPFLPVDLALKEIERTNSPDLLSLINPRTLLEMKQTRCSFLCRSILSKTVDHGDQFISSLIAFVSISKELNLAVLANSIHYFLAESDLFRFEGGQLMLVYSKVADALKFMHERINSHLKAGCFPTNSTLIRTLPYFIEKMVLYGLIPEDEVESFLVDHKVTSRLSYFEMGMVLHHGHSGADLIKALFRERIEGKPLWAIREKRQMLEVQLNLIYSVLKNYDISRFLDILEEALKENRRLAVEFNKDHLLELAMITFITKNSDEILFLAKEQSLFCRYQTFNKMLKTDQFF